MSALPCSPPAIPTAQDLLDAAKRACRHWGDDAAAQQEMTADCLAIPPHQRAELIQHFEETYP